MRTALASAFVVMILAGMAAPQGMAADPPRIDSRWLDRTASAAERQRMEAMIGLAPPDFTDGVRFLGEPVSLDDLLGKVVVIQFWSRADRRGSLRLEQLAALSERSGDGLAVIGVHVKEHAEGIERYLARRDPGVLVAVDTSGSFAAALGAQSELANLVIDRAGNARYALLNPSGIEGAVEGLLAEPAPSFEDDEGGPERPTPVPATATAPPTPRGKGAPGFWEERLPDERFPAISGEVGDANDLRGEAGPEIVVDAWITDLPDVRDKVVVVDFWATWCGPCVAAIPHMNRLQQSFPDEVAVIGVTAEPEDKVRQWMPGKGIKYSIGVDPQRRMGATVQNRYIPHAIVYSPDGVIRWQGNPSGLSVEDLGEIVNASRR